jgi:hypothetical protein
LVFRGTEDPSGELALFFGSLTEQAGSEIPKRMRSEIRFSITYIEVGFPNFRFLGTSKL